MIWDAQENCKYQENVWWHLTPNDEIHHQNGKKHQFEVRESLHAGHGHLDEICYEGQQTENTEVNTLSFKVHAQTGALYLYSIKVVRAWTEDVL